MRWIDRTIVPSVRIFCLPHAGGTETLFANWPQYLLPEIEVCAIRLPGRGDRFNEPLIVDMVELSNQIAQVIEALNDCPCAIYGDCAGALIGLATARALQSRNVTLRHLFAASTAIPDPKDIQHHLHRASDTEFRKAILALGMIDPQLATVDEMITFYLPQIRADVELCETYNYTTEHRRLACSITTLALAKDKLAQSRLYEEWQQQTTGEWQHKVFDFSSHHVAEDPFNFVKGSIRDALQNSGLPLSRP